MHPNFSILLHLQSEYLLSIILPRSKQIRERFLVILSFQIDEVLPDHVLQCGDVEPMLHMELWDL